MNRMFTLFKCVVTALCLAISSQAWSSLIGDDIMFCAMQNPPIPEQPLPPPCDVKRVVEEPTETIPVEIVQLNLVSSAPLPPPPATPDSFFDIFVDIDIDSESMLFDFQTQVFDLDIPPPFEPPLWQLWFEDLQWLDEFGRPVPGQIIGFWLWGINDSGNFMFDHDTSIPGIFEIHREPNAIHIDNFDPYQTVLFMQEQGFDALMIELHVEHVPEPDGFILFLLGSIALFSRKLAQLKSNT